MIVVSLVLAAIGLIGFLVLPFFLNKKDKIKSEIDALHEEIDLLLKQIEENKK